MSINIFISHLSTDNKFINNLKEHNVNIFYETVESDYINILDIRYKIYNIYNSDFNRIMSTESKIYIFCDNFFSLRICDRVNKMNISYTLIFAINLFEKLDNNC